MRNQQTTGEECQYGNERGPLHGSQTGQRMAGGTACGIPRTKTGQKTAAYHKEKTRHGQETGEREKLCRYRTGYLRDTHRTQIPERLLRHLCCAVMADDLSPDKTPEYNAQNKKEIPGLGFPVVSEKADPARSARCTYMPETRRNTQSLVGCKQKERNGQAY